MLCREPREVLGGADEGSGRFQDRWKATTSDKQKSTASRGDIQLDKWGKIKPETRWHRHSFAVTVDVWDILST